MRRSQSSSATTKRTRTSLTSTSAASWLIARRRSKNKDVVSLNEKKATPNGSLGLETSCGNDARNASVKGLVADINVQGQVAYLAQRMQADAWADFWQELELVLYSFEDLGLAASSTDAEIWNVCQREELILITDNRNLDSDDSMEATIRRHG